MKKLMYLIIVIGVLALVVAGCGTSVNPVVPSLEQNKAAKGAVWHVPGDFVTIQLAIDSADVETGDTIMVGPGEHAGAIVTKAVEIMGEDGAVINSGPDFYSWMAGFLFNDDSGSGAIISHLQFEIVKFPIFSGGANDITVEHCTLLNPIQGISNWMGSRWQISHNEIIDLCTADGGGIGIFIGDYMAIPEGVNDNLVSHNKITGTLFVDVGDGGGYNGTGIVLYADFRRDAEGAVGIENNRIVHNKISLISDTPVVVDVVAIELTDSINDANPVIVDNAIGFNDLRGTELQIVLTPDNLDECNDISRNLGDNRGHGLHPAAFGPGGN